MNAEGKVVAAVDSGLVSPNLSGAADALRLPNTFGFASPPFFSSSFYGAKRPPAEVAG